MVKKSTKKESVKKKEKLKKKEKSVFHKKSDAGKGDVPRTGLSPGEWAKKWEAIFGKKIKK
jgi:hypothetical protein|tara:strand:- start:1903 stop:2085 length:183 start_codon:yes stop_codon:yes gene_type:complete